MRQRLRLLFLLAAVAGVAGASAAIAADELTVTIKGPPDPSNSSTATFQFNANPPGGVTYECTLDDNTVPCDPPTYTDLTDGRHTFKVVAAAPGDKSGEASYAWTIDTKPPTVTITTKPTNPSGSRTPTFGFESQDDPSATFECWIDSAASEPCTSPYTTAELADGERTFNVRAKDAAGNTSSSSYTWTVDATPPTITVRSGPSASTSERAARFEFEVDDPAARIQCSIDAGAATDCGSPYTTPELGDGAHTFAVIATDPVGNAQRLTYEWTILTIQTIDTTPPDTADPVDYFVAYRYAELTWTRPPDEDFDHFTVFSISRGARVALYSGIATRYVSKKFDNAVDHRYEIVSYDRSGNASPAADVAISSSALLASPRRGAIVRRSPTLRWAPIARARFYNVQIFRNGRKIVSTWPRRPRVRLATRWRYGNPQRTYRLTRGTYEWYVWPAFGTRTRTRYGPAIGHSRFVFR